MNHDDYNHDHNHNHEHSMGHVHGYSLAVAPGREDHSHLAMNLTGPSIPIQGGGHIHQVMGYVSYQDGHFHYYSMQTSSAMPITGVRDKHVHYVQGETSMDDGHRHQMEFYTMVE
jgi:hypothetical protein